jgi:ABC-type Fe3+-hydroxamate transport system substrate-binding protein
METEFMDRNNLLPRRIRRVLLFCLVLVNFSPAIALGGMRSVPPERIDAIIVGDRVVDIAYHLGVLPRAMSVRGSLWPQAAKLKVSSQILGCPMYTTVKKKNTIPDALDSLRLKRVIVERNPHFCLYKPKVKPENVVPLLAGKEVTIEYVDFANGLSEAVRQTARLINREEMAEAVIAEYDKALAAAKSKLPAEKSGKRVVIFNGTYQAAGGRSMLRVEAPGGYSDKYLLEPLGWVNAGDCFEPQGGKVSKGHYPVKKKKSGLVLDPLLAADPDAIILLGDAFSVQRVFADYGAAHPEFAKLKAIRSGAVYALPAYYDSGVLEYPKVLSKWTVALAR